MDCVEKIIEKVGQPNERVCLAHGRKWPNDGPCEGADMAAAGLKNFDCPECRMTTGRSTCCRNTLCEAGRRTAENERRRAWGAYYHRVGKPFRPEESIARLRCENNRHPNDDRHEQRCNAPSRAGMSCTCSVPPELPTFLSDDANRILLKARAGRAFELSRIELTTAFETATAQIEKALATFGPLMREAMRRCLPIESADDNEPEIPAHVLAAATKAYCDELDMPRTGGINEVVVTRGMLPALIAALKEMRPHV